MYGQKIAEMIEEMVRYGASETEVQQALAIVKLLEPCLKIQSNGRYMTAHGDKTPLGLLRSIMHVMAENK